MGNIETRRHDGGVAWRRERWVNLFHIQGTSFRFVLPTEAVLPARLGSHGASKDPKAGAMIPRAAVSRCLLASGPLRISPVSRGEAELRQHLESWSPLASSI